MNALPKLHFLILIKKKLNINKKKKTETVWNNELYEGQIMPKRFVCAG